MEFRLEYILSAYENIVTFLYASSQYMAFFSLVLQLYEIFCTNFYVLPVNACYQSCLNVYSFLNTLFPSNRWKLSRVSVGFHWFTDNLVFHFMFVGRYYIWKHWARARKHINRHKVRICTYMYLRVLFTTIGNGHKNKMWWNAIFYDFLIWNK